MASEFFKSNVVTGLAAGVGATLLAPVLLPFLARLVKPLTKSVIKTGITVYEKGIESFAELTETLDDLVAEAKVELETNGAKAAGAVAAAGSAATTQPGKTDESQPGAAKTSTSQSGQAPASSQPGETGNAGRTETPGRPGNQPAGESETVENTAQPPVKPQEAGS